MTKKLFFLFALVGVIYLSSCSEIKKIYAYKQASLPGIRPGVITAENGESIQLPQRQNSFNYWFYISHSNSEVITITGVWINGKKHFIKSETVDRLPVLKFNLDALSARDTITLVPATNNAVTLIYPTGENIKTEKISKHLSRLIKENEFVVEYVRKGKKFLATKKQIKQLKAEALP